MTYTYIPRGVCAREIQVEIEDGIIKSAEFAGGCNGNTQGICKLVVGMDAEDAIERLEGIDCRGRGTSCPDQLANALKEALELE
ncbi:MAG: TIGR03905 family TSCPD domain-containing protein [Ruminococcus sp.]|nr:TIGR03905 family TSCPD domain-containing protein [Ruminococcus sp.]